MKGVVVPVLRAQSLVRHKSRLEREKEAAQRAAAAGAPGGSPQKRAAPSYMRATAASDAMRKVGGRVRSAGRDPRQALLDRVSHVLL